MANSNTNSNTKSNRRAFFAAQGLRQCNAPVDVIVGWCPENNWVHNSTDHVIGSILFEGKSEIESRAWLAQNPEWEVYETDEGDINDLFVKHNPS